LSSEIDNDADSMEVNTFDINFDVPNSNNDPEVSIQLEDEHIVRKEKKEIAKETTKDIDNIRKSKKYNTSLTIYYKKHRVKYSEILLVQLINADIFNNTHTIKDVPWQLIKMKAQNDFEKEYLLKVKKSEKKI
jgi:hypothetical protein